MIVTVNELKNILSSEKDYPLSYKNKIHYVNLSVSFDIETTSCYRKIETNEYFSNDYVKGLSPREQKKYEKIAFMYIWQFAYKEYQVMGREWKDFEKLIDMLHLRFNTEYKKIHFVIYVHNLSYEFQFIKDRFNFVDVFAIKERIPIKAITDNGIEFRCSYLLSGYSLAKLADNLQTHKIKKLVGDLDYKLIRNSKTELTDLEISYCINDILIVQYFIDECIERFGSIANIPNTQTGIVRRYVKKYCISDKNYYYQIKDLTLDKESFKSLRRAFQGGFTHGNIIYIGNVIKNVFSVDFTSSYPYCLVSEKYPMSKPILFTRGLTKATFKQLCNDNLCVFDVVFYNIESNYNINTIPSHKCYEKINAQIENGKIIKADKLRITVTNIDFEDISFFYSFAHFEIYNLFVYKKDYLPKRFIECVFKFYNDKTELKGIAGKETEYLHSKEMLNSLYGMCVTDIVRDNINCVNGKWLKSESDMDEKLKDYNSDRTRFLFYAWGVFCTSYARHNLFTGIKELIDKENIFKCDFIYSDTDSIKGLNYEKHKNFFDSYNLECEIKLKRMCDYHNFDYSILYPKTKDGKSKLMGVYDFEGEYQRFKTLGAKRYLAEKDNICYMTVSGLGKKAVDFLGETSDEKFKHFCNGVTFNSNESGKMTHTYIDTEKSGMIKDYQGNYSYFNEKSSIHLENTEFTLNLQGDYLDLIWNFQKMFNLHNMF